MRLMFLFDSRLEAPATHYQKYFTKTKLYRAHSLVRAVIPMKAGIKGAKGLKEPLSVTRR
jgi:hypothetical protein